MRSDQDSKFSAAQSCAAQELIRSGEMASAAGLPSQARVLFGIDEFTGQLNVQVDGKWSQSVAHWAEALGGIATVKTLNGEIVP